MFLIIFCYFFLFLICTSQEIITIEIDGSNLPDDSGTLSKGKEIFLKSCSNCHGYSGEGLYGPELVGRSSLNQKNTSKNYRKIFGHMLQKFLTTLNVQKEKKMKNFFQTQMFIV